MTTQITVRLPDDEVEFIDTEVAAGAAASRAAVVSRALRREMRRAANARDIAIMLKRPDVDLDDLAAYNAANADAVFGDLG